MYSDYYQLLMSNTLLEVTMFSNTQILLLQIVMLGAECTKIDEN